PHLRDVYSFPTLRSSDLRLSSQVRQICFCLYISLLTFLCYIVYRDILRTVRKRLVRSASRFLIYRHLTRLTASTFYVKAKSSFLDRKSTRLNSRHVSISY